MRRTRIIATVAACSIAALVGFAPAAAALPRNSDNCSGPVDELDEHLNHTGYYWLNCGGTWYRFKIGS